MPNDVTPANDWIRDKIAATHEVDRDDVTLVQAAIRLTCPDDTSISNNPYWAQIRYFLAEDEETTRWFNLTSGDAFTLMFASMIGVDVEVFTIENFLF